MQIHEAFNLIKDDIKKVEDAFKENLMTDVHLITRVGEYILTSGGKRFRPLILLLSARLAGYKGDKHIPLAAVVEFIHTATLLHDDVVDNASLRRGNISANSVWGNGVSVLVGDYLLSKAFQMAVKNGGVKILNALSETTTSMAEGEMEQLIKHSDAATTEEEYLNVITNKTAALFSLSCGIPAILSGLPKDKEDALFNYGREIGIAYQLIDDCLDYTSKDEELGKPVGSDLKEGHVTLPLIKAYRDGADAERLIMKEALEAGDGGMENLHKVFEMIKKYGGIAYTLDAARVRIERAKKHLDVFEPNVERAALTAVADFVIERGN